MSRNEFAGSRVLLVEDEEALAMGLEYNLTEEGYNVRMAADGKEAIDIFASVEFDLVILDIMLPYLDGFEVAKKMREKNPQIPILMLTARSGIKDRLRGLETGADDYMTKPFHLDEMLLRIQGMLRRKRWYRVKTDENPFYQIGKCTINFENLTCQSDKSEFQLTAREAILLKYLIENKDRIVSRQELLENVWHIHSEMETRTVDSFMARLRKYFEKDPKNPIYFKSVRGAGYMFREEGTRTQKRP